MHLTYPEHFKLLVFSCFLVELFPQETYSLILAPLSEFCAHCNISGVVAQYS